MIQSYKVFIMVLCLCIGLGSASAFAAGTYTLTYNGNGNTGGTTPAASDYPSGMTVGVPDNLGDLVKNGYVFNNWNTAADGSGVSYAYPQMVAMNGNVVLYANWIIERTVTFNGNGNTDGQVPASITVKNGGQISFPYVSMGKDGYYFAGWNSAADGSGTSYTGKVLLVDRDLVLYATWRPIPTFSLNYDGNGNTGGSVPSGQQNVNNNMIFPVEGNVNGLVKQGYVFNGWNTATDGSGKTYMPSSWFGQDATVGLNTLYAQWKAAYIVSYDGNGNTGGNAPEDNIAYEENASVTVSNNAKQLVKTGFTFAGWNTVAAGNGTAYAEGAKFVIGKANVTLYAQWTQNSTYTVTYNANASTAGTVPSDEGKYELNAKVTIKGNTGDLAKTGYEFIGWNTAADGSGTTYAASAAFNMGRANVTLYAKWSKDPTYTVKYNGNGSTGGTEPAENSYVEKDLVTVSGNTGGLVKTGNTFVVWNTAADGSGTSYAANATFAIGKANVMLYAQWTKPQPDAKPEPDAKPGSNTSDQAIKILIGGVQQNYNVPAVVKNGTTLVPMRAIFESLGAKIEWDSKTMTVIATKGKTVIKLTIGKAVAYVNNKPVKLALPAEAPNGSTMVPLRFVSEALGNKVSWDGAKQTISITNR
ncbi:InlB B-repeat-containing protein [Paenibacillus sp. OV219]|uniref:InlB B-repeat-containing protein n=1 Tax=Paenibacillus sp. OV219 TaxID=1884377 RepID=UPI0008B4C22C|nr:InlB B-repeat-containing protein [Paenibacillus sp. OV219]SEO80248.1 Listeria/Bacterioides repeat-containing protein [Paenibacillus sp. OV219]